MRQGFTPAVVIDSLRRLRKTALTAVTTKSE